MATPKTAREWNARYTVVRAHCRATDHDCVTCQHHQDTLAWELPAGVGMAQDPCHFAQRPAGDLPEWLAVALAEADRADKAEARAIVAEAERDAARRPVINTTGATFAEIIGAIPEE